MKDKIAYGIILFAAILNWLLLLFSTEYNKCNQKQNYAVQIIILFSLFLHYFINAFGLYGFLFNNKYILILYLFTPIIIGLGWSLNKTKYFKSACTLTHATDLMCDIKKGDTLYFVDIFRVFGVNDVNIGYTKTSPIFITITTIGYTIALYKLYKMLIK